MSTSTKLLETLRRLVNSPIYFYRYFKSVSNQYSTGKALLLALERTLKFIFDTKNVWK